MDGHILCHIIARSSDYAKDVRMGRSWTHRYHRVLDSMQRTPAIVILQSKPRLHMEAANRTLFSFSTVFASLRCSDVRDRIYAALPLLEPGHLEKLSISPDYSLSVPELFEAMYDIFLRVDFYQNREWLSRQMWLIREMLELDRNDHTVKRIFGQIWEPPDTYTSECTKYYDKQFEWWIGRLVPDSYPLQRERADGYVEDVYD